MLGILVGYHNRRLSHGSANNRTRKTSIMRLDWFIAGLS